MPSGTDLSLCSAREGTRVSEQSWLLSEIRTHRIELDVANYIGHLLIRSHPAIKRLILPEVLSGSTQNLIRAFCGHAFHELSNLRRGNFGANQEVNMIRHHHECDQFIVAARSLAKPNRIGDARCDFRLLQPGWPQRSSLEFTIREYKSTPITSGGNRQGAVEPERDEQRCSIRLKVRKVAPVFQLLLVIRPSGFSHSLLTD
jgi:hypothetical protein